MDSEFSHQERCLLLKVSFVVRMFVIICSPMAGTYIKSGRIPGKLMLELVKMSFLGFPHSKLFCTWGFGGGVIGVVIFGVSMGFGFGLAGMFVEKSNCEISMWCLLYLVMCYT